MSKKFIGLFVAAAFIFLFAQASFAQNANVKIGYVGLNRIFDQYPKTSEYDKVLEQKSTQYKKDRNDLLGKIQDAERRLILLKEEDRVKLAEQIQKDKENLVEFDQKKQTELRKERDDKVREILLEIESVVQNYAKKEGFDIIVSDRALIYGTEALDLTQKILDALSVKQPTAPKK